MKLAVIPARGGSKRIPKKNIRDFLGKPIIAYSIEVAINSGLFDEVIVSTDDEEIAAVANKYGANTPFVRPSELADDFTGTNDVVKHSIQWFKEHNYSIDYACCIYATAPFLKYEYLMEGFESLVHSKRSFAFSVTSYEFPIQRAIKITEDESVEAIFPENIYRRSQDLTEAYHDAAQFYWGKSDAFLNEEKLFSSASVAVRIPRYLVQDIDTLDDWRRAELMYKGLLASMSK